MWAGNDPPADPFGVERLNDYGQEYYNQLVSKLQGTGEIWVSPSAVPDGAHFGAFTPGTTTSGIQEAWNYVANLANGPVLKYKPGVFTINSQLVLPATTGSSCGLVNIGTQRSCTWKFNYSPGAGSSAIVMASTVNAHFFIMMNFTFDFNSNTFLSGLDLSASSETSHPCLIQGIYGLNDTNLAGSLVDASHCEDSFLLSNYSVNSSLNYQIVNGRGCVANNSCTRLLTAALYLFSWGNTWFSGVTLFDANGTTNCYDLNDFFNGGASSDGKPFLTNGTKTIMLKLGGDIQIGNGGTSFIQGTNIANVTVCNNGCKWVRTNTAHAAPVPIFASGTNTVYGYILDVVGQTNAQLMGTSYFCVRIGNTTFGMGLDPAGTPGTPTSGVAQSNPFPFTVTIYFTGFTGTAVAINGTTVQGQASAALRGSIELNPGDTWSITYTVAGTIHWQLPAGLY